MNDKLSKLVDDLAAALPESVVAHLRSLVNAGEYKLAVEELCAYIGEADYKVDPGDWQRIEQLGNEFGVDPSWWNALPRS